MNRLRSHFDFLGDAATDERIIKATQIMRAWEARSKAMGYLNALADISAKYGPQSPQMVQANDQWKATLAAQRPALAEIEKGTMTAQGGGADASSVPPSPDPAWSKQFYQRFYATDWEGAWRIAGAILTPTGWQTISNWLTADNEFWRVYDNLGAIVRNVASTVVSAASLPLPAMLLFGVVALVGLSFIRGRGR